MITRERAEMILENPDTGRLSAPAYLWKFDALSEAQQVAYSRLKMGDTGVAAWLMGELFLNHDGLRPLLNESKDVVITAAPYVKPGPVNAADLLARALSAKTGIRYIPLGKTKRPGSAPYYDLSPEERVWRTQQEVCVESPMAFRGKRAVIIDDCVATGAIMSVCTSKLAEAGVKRVDPIVVAYLGQHNAISERRLDRSEINGNSAQKLVNFLQQGGITVTTRLLTFLWNLSPLDFNAVMSSLPFSMRKSIETDAKHYLA